MEFSKDILTYQKSKELEDFYGLKPTTTQYRNVVLLPICKEDENIIDQPTPPLPNLEQISRSGFEDVSTSHGVGKTSRRALELVEIHELAKQDRSFCQRLKDDRKFHDQFWYWNRSDGGKSINCSPLKEKEATVIEQAIRKRVALVVCQKEYIRDCMLPQEQIRELQELANIELGYMVQWTNEEKPGHRELRAKIEKAFALDFVQATNDMA